MIHSYILCSYKMHELKALRLEFPNVLHLLEVTYTIVKAITAKYRGQGQSWSTST